MQLGPNERYRYAIELAGARTGIHPAALAALISAEAAVIGGTALAEATDEEFHKRHPELKGRALHKGEDGLIAEWQQIHQDLARTWDPSSYNAESGAGGLTQFTAGTWRDEARRPGTYLNEVAATKGYVDSKNRLTAGKDDELLRLRFDATVSIVAAAELGSSRLAELERRGLMPANVDSDEKAKYMYLAHHEGVRGAERVLNGTLTDTAAKGLIEDNIPDQGKRDVLIKQHGGEAKAYMTWLDSYIKDRIQPDRFRPKSEP